MDKNECDTVLVGQIYSGKTTREILDSINDAENNSRTLRPSDLAPLVVVIV